MKHLIIILIIAAVAGISVNVAAQETKDLSPHYDKLVKQRAVEAVIWGMPAVNYDRLYQAADAAGAGPNQIVYWSRPVTWKNQTLTPNPKTKGAL